MRAHLQCRGFIRAHLAHREMTDVHPDRSPALHQTLLPKLLHEQPQAELLACPRLCAKGGLARPRADLRLQQRTPFMLQSTGNLLESADASRYQSMRHDPANYSCLNAFEAAPMNTVARTRPAAVLQYASAFSVFISVFPVAALQLP